jgi:hypothetical protein
MSGIPSKAVITGVGIGVLGDVGFHDKAAISLDAGSHPMKSAFTT